MRTLRLSLTGAVVLMLLGGLSGAVVAQEQAPAAHITGVEVDAAFPSSGTRSLEDTVRMFRDAVTGLTVEWSDSRLPATLVSATNTDEYTVTNVGDGIWLSTGAARMDAPEGAWVGTASSFGHPKREAANRFEMAGEGAYDGLMLVMDMWMNDEDVLVFDGLIVEGELPPLPDPVDPPAVSEK